MNNIIKVLRNAEKSYISGEDWEVRENANETTSYGNFMSYFLDKILKSESVLSYFFPQDAVKSHFNGEVHIHKLPNSLYIPYCVGWSFPKILKIGLKTPTLTSKPAAHLDAAVNHFINFIFLTAQEWSGAMAVSAFDLFTAPFARADKLSDRQIKQVLQSMCFELNYPSRMGFQSPFSNITIVLDTVETFMEMSAIVDGKQVGKVEDYLDEAIRITKQLAALYNEGDAAGAPFTFPIPTLMLTKRFDWANRRWDGLTDIIFENLAKKGSFYLLNGYSTDVEVLYSMCCRLVIDVSKFESHALKKASEDLKEILEKKSYARGIWAIPDATGSIGVVTINLPRIAYLSKGDEDKFNELLRDKLEIARETLVKMRERYEKSLNSGLMPMTLLYLGAFLNHYNTFGLVGLPEAAANFMQNPELWNILSKNEIKEALKWMKNTVKFVGKYAEECCNEDGFLYNVEEIPAESTAYKFASADLKKFKRDLKDKKILIPTENGVPFYSNSIVPYYAKVSIAQRAKWEGEVQKEFTGGVMMHLFLYESPDPKALKKLVHKIATNTNVVYFSITPTIAVCRKCGWSGVGVYDDCPKCKGKVELWSRIVGYYRPVRNWNIGKKAEFLKRVKYGKNGESVVTSNLISRKLF